MADAKRGKPAVILIGTGSEVALCSEAYEALKQEGVAARLVSMPSWELFEQQDQTYRDSVLPPAVKARVSVEAGSVIGWDRYVGPGGARIGMHTFGASAPIKDVMKKFGFTPEAVLAAAKQQLGLVQGEGGMNPLKQLEALGQSLWLDYMKRSLIERRTSHAHRARWVEGRHVKPLDLRESHRRDRRIRRRAEAVSSTGGPQHFRDLRTSCNRRYSCRRRRAASGLRATQSRDGYISLECSPYLANDTEATVAEALRLWAAVDRPNLMVKVPATPAGIPAIRQLIGRGLNINITLLFSVSVYEQVVEAYISGLEDLKKSGGDISKISSVASFFVSRIDTAVDKQLDKLDDKEAADELRGKAAIANAKLAYVQYKALFSGPRWERLAAAGAKTQRLLWASTSTKNPTYKDTMYVEGSSVANRGHHSAGDDGCVPRPRPGDSRCHRAGHIGRTCGARGVGEARHLIEGGHG